jgi:glycosyltransferase involved in cell wall biosynthesis
VHNLFPLLSGSVPWQAGRRGLPVVWTVHNRRVRCVAGTNFRDGRPCEDCRPGWRVPGIRHACYGGGSTAASALVTASTSLFASLARRRVTAVAISEALRQWLVDDGGFAAERVLVKYNGVETATATAGAPPPEASRDFVYAGHLSAHKGVPLLLDAWRRAELPAGHRLHLAGDGDLAGAVREAADRDPRITWHGNLPLPEVHGLLAGARAAIVPSVCQEAFGRVAAEAMACGRPVLTTGIAGLAEVVDDGCGWVTGDDPGALAAALVDAAADDAGVARRGEAAARRHRERFSPTATTRALLDVYERCLEGQSSG